MIKSKMFSAVPALLILNEINRMGLANEVQATYYKIATTEWSQ